MKKIIAILIAALILVPVYAYGDDETFSLQNDSLKITAPEGWEFSDDAYDEFHEEVIGYGDGYVLYNALRGVKENVILDLAYIYNENFEGTDDKDLKTVKKDYTGEGKEALDIYLPRLIFTEDEYSISEVGSLEGKTSDYLKLKLVQDGNYYIYFGKESKNAYEIITIYSNENELTKAEISEAEKIIKNLDDSGCLDSMMEASGPAGNGDKGDFRFAYVGFAISIILIIGGIIVYRNVGKH